MKKSNVTEEIRHYSAIRRLILSEIFENFEKFKALFPNKTSSSLDPKVCLQETLFTCGLPTSFLHLCLFALHGLLLDPNTQYGYRTMAEYPLSS